MVAVWLGEGVDVQLTVEGEHELVMDGEPWVGVGVKVRLCVRVAPLVAVSEPEDERVRVQEGLGDGLQLGVGLGLRLYTRLTDAETVSILEAVAVAVVEWLSVGAPVAVSVREDLLLETRDRDGELLKVAEWLKVCVRVLVWHAVHVKVGVWVMVPLDKVGDRETELVGELDTLGSRLRVVVRDQELAEGVELKEPDRKAVRVGDVVADGGLTERVELATSVAVWLDWAEKLGEKLLVGDHERLGRALRVGVTESVCRDADRVDTLRVKVGLAVHEDLVWVAESDGGTVGVGVMVHGEGEAVVGVPEGLVVREMVERDSDAEGETIDGLLDCVPGLQVGDVGDGVPTEPVGERDTEAVRVRVGVVVGERFSEHVTLGVSVLDGLRVSEGVWLAEVIEAEGGVPITVPDEVGEAVCVGVPVGDWEKLGVQLALRLTTSEPESVAVTDSGLDAEGVGVGLELNVRP
mmetsp:Transcript_13987/g.24950  ORF Transcript_13987/g.24950 Transcript_13987/m.24950 type:complete len:464 (-) Transcript_13987:1069-2460(-)